VDGFHCFAVGGNSIKGIQENGYANKWNRCVGLFLLTSGVFLGIVLLRRGVGGIVRVPAMIFTLMVVSMFRLGLGLLLVSGLCCEVEEGG
jgi:hypothetical protein